MNMSVLCYGVRLEIAPGVTVPVESCSTADLAAAHALRGRKERLLAECGRMVHDAARYNLPISPELRERITLWDGDLNEIQQLRDELENALLQAA